MSELPSSNPVDTALVAELKRLAAHYGGYVGDQLGNAALRIEGLREEIRNAHETSAPPEMPEHLSDADAERLANYVGAFESLKEKSAKELVDLALEHLIDLKPFHELLVEELCSRVHPGWENDEPSSQLKTTAPKTGHMGDINGPGCDPDVP